MVRFAPLVAVSAALALASPAAEKPPDESALYFPAPDAAGGWRGRAPEHPAKLDECFEFVKTTSKNGGLLVAHKGWLIYERYFGKGHRDAMPNTASCGKSFTSVAAGILIADRPELFPDGLDQKVFTPQFLPSEAFPLRDPAMARITMGQLLSMTAGIPGNNLGYAEGRQVMLDAPGPDGWQACVDATALGLRLWCRPGEGYSYATASIHLASIIVRHVSGMELEEFVRTRLAEPMGFGRWGWGYRRPEIAHTPGGGGIALHATDMLRFAYLLLREGRWGSRRLAPAAFIRECGRLSKGNPHFPESLTFEVNGDGHVAGVPRDAFWKQGSGGHCFYIVPSLELAFYKLGGRDGQYDPADTGLEPVPFRYDGSRESWKPSANGDAAAFETLRMVVAAIRP